MEANVFICPSCERENRVDDGECECGYDQGLHQEVVQYAPQNALAATLKAVEGENGTFLTSEIGQLWSLEGEDVKSFIKQIELKFKRKRKNHSWIAETSIPTSTAEALKKYNENGDDFESLVNSIVDNLTSQAALKTPTPAGGAVIFIHYHKDNEQESLGRIFVIMVNNTKAFNFDDNLVPTKFPSIDMDALRQAALIDLTLFDEIYPSKDGEPYVQFITGKSSSDFFKTAIGCIEDLDNNRSIQDAKKALVDFCHHKTISPLTRVQLLKNFEALMSERAKSKINKTITLKDMEAVVDKTLPEGSPDKNKFEQFALLGDYKINEYFEPSRFSSSEFGKISLSDSESDYKVSVSVGALNDDINSDAKIIFDRSQSKLIIRLSDDDVKIIDDVFNG